ncbi:hypothetical protein NC239_06210 [Streptomyces sp. G3]|uniref:hypothetical protein n=1 Tax=unclassified Streptomyces TaxID=2593676 RepID=UPI001F40E60C|nr:MULTISPECIES: hypothetical protein [unclassified Streptomyces]MCM1937804.1 hypothetical protein [Streptomyces sp. G3]WKX19302.1 hypothetical protein Q3Y68_15100 [Streptomyces sp. HUAS CX7]
MTTPTLLTGALAATEAGVSPATIRKWVQLGRLSPAGKQGRAQLFRLEDVFAAERDARRVGRGGRPGASGRDAQGVHA